MVPMSHYRVSEAADLLGVSADTVRRTIDAGELDSARGESGRVIVPGQALAQWAQERANSPTGGSATRARYRVTGMVTAIADGEVMARVDLQWSSYRVVSV